LAPLVEADIYRAIEQRHLTLVGWYHSHPFAAATPTLRDIDAQLDYQIRMKGNSDASYTPCVGVICCECHMATMARFHVDYVTLQRTVRFFMHFSRFKNFFFILDFMHHFFHYLYSMKTRLYVHAEGDHFQHLLWTELEILKAFQTLKIRCISVRDF
jgi:hypothetical protein